MTEDQIKHMVDRFLGWKLPRDTFNPDCGISFDKGVVNAHTPYPSFHEPTGTNLFDADQATEMVRYMIRGLPTAISDASKLSLAQLLTDIKGEFLVEGSTRKRIDEQLAALSEPVSRL